MARKTSKPAVKSKPKPSRSPVAKGKAIVVVDVAVPVVGLGASAGGLQAFSAFLVTTPSDTGAAFVLVHHVDPNHKSHMADLLANHTSMPVVLAADKSKVQADHVYVIPPNNYLEIKKGVLHLSEPTDRRGTRLPIDVFLRSLAKNSGQNAIAIILSGTGSDGSAAIREIKEQGGIVLVQDPAEAEHDGMPRSAIATGAADHVVAVAKMPEIITNYVRHPFVQNGTVKKVLGDNAKGSLDQIIAVLKAHSSINFNLYKDGTLLRRIERRMALRHMENSGDYLALLKDSAEEAQSLCADLLISVTSFFRDEDAFEYLDTTLLEGLVKSHDAGHPVRIWVPGCATGEEAYSLAMLVIEKISTLRKDVKLQIFASDVDERALTVARNGVYPDSIAEGVSPARLRRFFTKEDDSYRVMPKLRDAVVFANQNILADAPFSKLDLISCRNLMIYLTPDAQERVIQMFHFALHDGGALFLGMSETTGNHEALFHPLSKKFRVYKRVGHTRSRAFDFPIAQRPLSNVGLIPKRSPFQASGSKLAELSQSLLVEHYAPAAVLIDAQSETLYFEGPTDRYLRMPSGEASHDLLAMARQGLRARLSSAMRTARQTETDATETATITRGSDRVGVTIQVHPVKLDETKLLLVTFTDHPMTPTTPVADALNGAVNRQLEQELENTQTDLRNTIRDFEGTTEELKAVNEEAMSMNEEFQSTNEELETSKEELQSLNEELTTLNTQLQQKIDDERRLSDDLNNLLSSSGIATLFLDNDFTIMRFTPATRDLFNVLSKDIGRPFSDITGRVNDPDLLKDAETVLETLVPAECEVESDGGRWFVRRILPYRTQEGKTNGVVVPFSDISDLKVLQQQTAAARQFAENIVDTVREPLLVLDRTFTIISASQSFHRVFATRGADLVGKGLFSIQEQQWDAPKLRALLEEILPKKTVVQSFEVTLDVGDLGQRSMVLNARKIEEGPGGAGFILLAMEDVTEHNRADELFLANIEKDRRAEELVFANKEKDKRADELFLANIEKDRRADELTLANQNLVLRTDQLVKAQKMEAIGRLTAGIAHDFNNLLAVIYWNVELAELSSPLSAETVEHLAIKQAINSGSAMTKRLVASSTMTVLASRPTEIADLIRNKISVYTLLLGTTIDFTFSAEPALWPALVDENRFDDAIYNLIANAKDAMPHGGNLSVTAENVIIDEKKAASFGDISEGMFVLVTVSDDGCGIEPELLSIVFDPFYTSKQFGESNGMGLSMVYGFAKQTGGHVLIESELSVSTRVKLYLPRATTLANFAPEAEAEAVMPDKYIGSRILVVEDNPEILSACQRALEIQGFQVVTALNGRDAIARLSEELPFDLLFSDIVLPGDMSGIDVQREAHLLHPTIKSILTTGFAEAASVGNESAVKDTDILRKPYSRKDLMDRIEAALAS
jgi:two-component system CheB/CheR fusion protein